MSTTAPGIECLELEVDQLFTANAHVDIEPSTDRSSSTNETQDTQGEEFQYEHGRRYHAVERETYSLPNDNAESQRLDIQDLAWKLSLKGGLHVAPVADDIKCAVDLGAGTGLWAMDFATAHPQCKVIGTDLVSIQPTDGVPSNCTFITQNFNELWEFAEPIDLVHGRMLTLGTRSWDHFFEQAYINLKPGGWVDLQEVWMPVEYIDDGNITEDSPLPMFSKYAIDATSKFGINLAASGKFKEMATGRGFTNMQYERVKWPIGPWPKNYSKEKQIGALIEKNTCDYFLEGLALRTFTRGLGWSEQEVRDFVVKVKAELEDRKKHYHWVVVVFCAQKPLDASS